MTSSQWFQIRNNKNKLTLICLDRDIIYIQNDLRPLFCICICILQDIDDNVPIAKTFFNMRLHDQSVKAYQTCKYIDIADLF